MKLGQCAFEGPSDVEGVRAVLRGDHQHHGGLTHHRCATNRRFRGVHHACYIAKGEIGTVLLEKQCPRQLRGGDGLTFGLEDNSLVRRVEKSGSADADDPTRCPKEVLNTQIMLYQSFLIELDLNLLCLASEDRDFRDPRDGQNARLYRPVGNRPNRHERLCLGSEADGQHDAGRGSQRSQHRWVHPGGNTPGQRG